MLPRKTIRDDRALLLSKSTIPGKPAAAKKMADLEKARYNVDAGLAGDESDGADVKRGTITEAADLYGDEATAERKLSTRRKFRRQLLKPVLQIMDM